MTRIGINGFGRMGRLALRAAWGRPDLEFVHVNELRGGAETAAHLLEFDSVHGRWDHDVRSDGDASLTIDGLELGFSEHGAPGDVRWDELGAKRIILTHMAPEMLAAAGSLPEECAFDGMIVEL